MKLPCCQDEALRKALVRFRVPADATALVSCGSCAKLFEATTKFIYKINTHTHNQIQLFVRCASLKMQRIF